MKNLILFDDIPNEFYADEKYQVIDIEALRFILDTIEWDCYPPDSEVGEEYICPICERDSNVGHSDICVLKNMKEQVKEESSKDRVAYCGKCKKAAALEQMSHTFAGNFCTDCSKQLRLEIDSSYTFIHTRGDDD